MSLPCARIVAAALAMVAAATDLACALPQRLAADAIVTHAAIWTGNPLQPEAEAVAIIGDRFVDVGRADEVGRWRGPNTTVIDAEGARVVPGFNDAHVHLVEGGLQLDAVDLRDAASPAELARRIGERARTKPGDWILGGGWDERTWSPPDLPTRALIDDLTTSGTPVFVTRLDGRMGLANAAALGRAGITERTRDPRGGAIVRDVRGFPTGVLQGTAMLAVSGIVPRMTREQRLQIVKRALQHAASLGITSLQDMDADYDAIAVYAELASRHELTARVYAAPSESFWYDQAKLGLRRAFGSAWLRIGAVSGRIADARLADDHRTRLMAADHAGLQISLEAGAPAGASQALDLAADLVRADGDRDRRFRVDHAEMAAAADIARFASLRAIAAVDAPSPDVFARFAAGRARLALGSDWPAAPLNPLPILSAAASSAPIAAAIAAYTAGSAFAEFQEAEKGTIARGTLADLVILSDDVFRIPATEIAGVRVLTTIAGGTIVHQRRR